MSESARINSGDWKRFSAARFAEALDFRRVLYTNMDVFIERRVLTADVLTTYIDFMG